MNYYHRLAVWLRNTLQHPNEWEQGDPVVEDVEVFALVHKNSGSTLYIPARGEWQFAGSRFPEDQDGTLRSGFLSCVRKVLENKVETQAEKICRELHISD